METFAGEWVHSAQWRDSVAVAGRRVGVIGSGSTGVQLVTALGGVASEIRHFQRTPQWIFPGVDLEFSARLRRLLERVTPHPIPTGGGAARQRLRLFPQFVAAHLLVLKQVRRPPNFR